MKKFMVMIAAIAFGVAANAATVTWSSSGLKTADVSGNFTATSLSGAVAYLFFGAQDTAGLNASIQAGTFTGAGNLFTKTTTTTGGIAQAGIGSYSNQDVTLYMVLFDGPTIAESSWYMISTDVTLTFVNSNLTYLYTTANGRLPTQWTAVPEPTAMALLALGVAAIGLRRKNTK